MATVEKEKKILITGGAGFIGSNLVNYHLNKGDIVTVIDDLSTGTFDNIKQHQENKNFKFIESHLLTCKQIAAEIKKTELIYHLAFTVGVKYVLDHPFEVLHDNLKTCERILDLAKEHNPNTRIIIASSSEVYGNQKETLAENMELKIPSPIHLRSQYPICKLSNEAQGLAYYRKYGLPITIVRLFNTIGENQMGRYGMVVPRFIKQALSKEPITVYGSGEQRRCFCDIKDQINILSKIVDCEKSIGMILNSGNNNEISIKELAEKIRQLTNSESEIIYQSYKEAYGHEFEDIQRRVPDLNLLKEHIEVDFQWSLDKTLNNLIQEKREELTQQDSNG